MIVIETVNKQLPAILYDYWETIPPVIEINDPKKGKKIGNPIRGRILQALSKGKYDVVNGIKKRRRALTVNEILELIKQKREVKIKKTGLYYHIQQLVDAGTVKEVYTNQQGNITTTYFGRTSKLVLSSYDDEGEKKGHSLQYLSYEEDFEILLKRFGDSNGTIETETDIRDLLNRLLEIRSKIPHPGISYIDWVKKHHDKIQGLDLDLLDFFRIYNELKSYPPDLFKLLLRLRGILEID